MITTQRVISQSRRPLYTFLCLDTSGVSWYKTSTNQIISSLGIEYEGQQIEFMSDGRITREVIKEWAHDELLPLS